MEPFFKISLFDLRLFYGGNGPSGNVLNGLYSLFVDIRNKLGSVNLIFLVLQRFRHFTYFLTSIHHNPYTKWNSFTFPPVACFW